LGLSFTASSQLCDFDTFCKRRTRFDCELVTGSFVAYFRKGKRVGTWIYFDQQKSLEKIIHYRSGKFQKMMRYENGILREVRDKKNRTIMYSGCGC